MENKVKRKRPFYGWVVVISVSLIILLQWGICNTCFAIYLPEIAKTIGTSTTVVSGAFSFGYVISLIWCIVFGYLSDKFGARKILIIGVVGASIGQILMKFVTNTWLLYLIFGFLGQIGQAASWVGGISIVSRWFVKKRGFALGAAQGFAGIGAFFSIFAEITVQALGWQNSTWILGLTMLVISLPLIFLIRTDPGEKGLFPDGGVEALKPEEEERLDLPEDSEEGFPFKDAILSPQFWLLFFVATMFMIKGGVSVNFKDILVTGGYDGMLAAKVLTIAGIFNTIGAFASGWISDRLGRKKTLVVGFAINCCSALIGLIAYKKWHFIIWGILGGLTSSVYVIFATLLADWYGPKCFGRLFGVFQGAETIGGAAGPVLIAMIANRFYWRAPFLFTAGTLALGVIIMLFLRKPKLRTARAETA